MAYTEKCRGCCFENKCDYITCRTSETNFPASSIRNSCGNIDFGFMDSTIHKIVKEMITTAEQDSYQKGFLDAISKYQKMILGNAEAFFSVNLEELLKFYAENLKRENNISLDD